VCYLCRHCARGHRYRSPRYWEKARLNARLFGKLSTLSILESCFARLLTRNGRAAACDSPIDHSGCTLFQRFESPFGNKLLGQCAGFANYESNLSILSRPEDERAIAKRQIESLGTKTETIVSEKSNKIIIDSAATFRKAWNHSATRAQMQHWPCNPLHKPHHLSESVLEKEISNEASICSRHFGMERLPTLFHIGANSISERCFCYPEQSKPDRVEHRSDRLLG
jgi:hypothetical protein